MTVLLIIAIVALFGITLWQLSKIFKMSQTSASGSDNQVANDKDNKYNGYLMLAFVIFIYAITIYCFIAYRDFYLPEAASEHGSEYDSLFFITLVVIMITQIITQFLVHYFAYKYKGKEGNRALFLADNDKLEFIWTITPVIVLSGLIFYGLYTWSDIMNINDDDDPLVVEVYAYQFGWIVRYSGEDNTLGKANVRFIEGINTVGIDETDTYAMDDVVARELHLPVDRPVLFKFRSQDVLHSAYMPFFRAQMNVVPGMITQFKFTPTITSEEMRNSEFMVDKVRKLNKIRRERSKELIADGQEGLDTYEFEYYLLCNKICGISHYNMQIKIVVEPQEEFDAWMAKQTEFGKEIASK
ncbi:cytochrome c oxidase subunit II [Gangjinia marincola]|uniref:cytochrome-c oxidase n=1 Tax=Gangjinia marincola TaxID=578463 RepID=A0ABP3XQB2_9FLAO